MSHCSPLWSLFPPSARLKLASGVYTCPLSLWEDSFEIAVSRLALDWYPSYSNLCSSFIYAFEPLSDLFQNLFESPFLSFISKNARFLRSLVFARFFKNLRALIWNKINKFCHKRATWMLLILCKCHVFSASSFLSIKQTNFFKQREFLLLQGSSNGKTEIVEFPSFTFTTFTRRNWIKIKLR